VSSVTCTFYCSFWWITARRASDDILK